MILAIDPGLTTFGWAQISDDGQVLELGVLEQQVEGARKDHARRVARQAAFVIARARGARFVIAEAMSFPRGVAGVASICLSWGALVGACSAIGVPLKATRPQEWQRAAAGPSQAKGPIDYDALLLRLQRHVDKYGTAVARADLVRVLPSKRTHALDAVGVGLFGFIRRDHPTVDPAGST